MSALMGLIVLYRHLTGSETEAQGVLKPAQNPPANRQLQKGVSGWNPGPEGRREKADE